MTAVFVSSTNFGRLSISFYDAITRNCVQVSFPQELNRPAHLLRLVKRWKHHIKLNRNKSSVPCQVRPLIERWLATRRCSRTPPALARKQNEFFRVSNADWFPRLIIMYHKAFNRNPNFNTRLFNGTILIISLNIWTFEWSGNKERAETKDARFFSLWKNVCNLTSARLNRRILRLIVTWS